MAPRKVPPMLQVAVKYGLIGSFLVMILIVVMYNLGKHPMMIPVVLDFRMILFPLFLVLAMRDFRIYRNQGIMHMWQGLGLGIMTYVIIGMVGAWFIYGYAIYHPDFLKDYVDFYLEQLQTSKEVFIESVGIEAYEHALEKLPLTTARDLALDYFIKSMPLGLFWTIILSVIIRRKPKT